MKISTHYSMQQMKEESNTPKKATYEKSKIPTHQKNAAQERGLVHIKECNIWTP